MSSPSGSTARRWIAGRRVLPESEHELLEERELFLELRVLGLSSVACLRQRVLRAARHRELGSSVALRARAPRPRARASRPRVSSVRAARSTSLRLKPPRIWPKSKPHHHMPADDREQRAAMRRAPVPRQLRAHRHARRADAEVLAHAAPRRHAMASALRARPARAVRPGVSGRPNMRFMFCTACPAAPLTRLSIDRRARRPCRRRCGRWTAMRQTLARAPQRVSGWRARRHHVDERLARVALLEQRLQVDVGVGEPRVQRRVDAADHRQSDAA